MSASNIYLRLITASGPVIGEGLLEGWETSIELKSFDWGMEWKEPEAKGKDDPLKAAARAAVNMLGIGKANVKLGQLKVTKRFDLSSYHLHLCVDHDIKVISATITVLHMKPNVIPPHAPGFVLNFVNGYVTDVSLKLGRDGNMSELVEEVTFEMESVQMQYLKPIAGQPTPMAPFFYPSPLNL